MAARVGSACLPPRPKDIFCRICGGLRLHGDGHDQSLFHRSQASGKNSDVLGPWRVEDSVEHSDAIWCFGARLARDRIFAATALVAVGLQGVAGLALATVPPRPPTLPTKDQAKPS
ncbi:hypothetical protein IscW_ISCW004174 [Ixodes scapularis]|uniref:Uncharacterized protein n=1 Tax=Ixodes scapularis TaxID=6945 RepID=B7PJ95_IXOSC|nr:hypothetical protein IscW_ISCW004174 [Ixodes scapularis]|eukprot:XP_002407419.1 hypothetical protein IscW_ISCW004174 [Ixodes scapularis]